MPLDALRKQWDARAASAPLHCAMTFEGDDLVLGSGTRLAVVKRAAPGAETDLSTNDARLVAMLSAAYRRSIGTAVLAYVHRALVKRSGGETALALTHLALTGLPKLAHPEQDSRRLFMADGLMKAGISPRTIFQALGLNDSSLNELERRYNPDQPRVPAGSGWESGQWTDGANASSARSGRAHTRWRYAAGAESDSEMLPSEQEAESEPVTFYNPITRQTISFPANSALEPRLPPGFINLNELPKGPTYLSAPGGGNEAEIDSGEAQEAAPTSADRAKARAAQMVANRLAGAKWETTVRACRIQDGETVASQATVMSYKGNITRTDFLTRDPLTDSISVIEAKSSQTATLTPRQTVALPEINEGGGTYIGPGRPGFPRGTIIPPGRVRIIRPNPEKFMTIDQPDIIDMTAINEEKGEISLIISDHLPWDIDEGEHLWTLQSKINRYLDAIESGELYQKRPAAIGKHIVIDIVAKFPLSKTARSFVEKCQAFMLEIGIELRYEHLVLDSNGKRIPPNSARGATH